MEYLLGQMDPVQFQRLVNAILVHRFGDQVRITPLRGPDGGRDAETAPGNPYLMRLDPNAGSASPHNIPLVGRYLFQTKHHRTIDSQITALRKKVIRDFQEELHQNVLPLTGENGVDHFFLITNVPASRDALRSLDNVRSDVLGERKEIHADIWWRDQIVAYLDQMPTIWASFPEIFPGRIIPALGAIAGSAIDELPMVLRLMLDRQYNRDKRVKFRQIELEQSLGRLFVDLDLKIDELSEEARQQLTRLDRIRRSDRGNIDHPATPLGSSDPRCVSALNLLLSEDNNFSGRMLIEGGPGQGKSTITQLVAQIYRAMLLNKRDPDIDVRFRTPDLARLPLRVELRSMGDYFTAHPHRSVEEYLVEVANHESGGGSIDVSAFHSFVVRTPVLLLFDGLDEVGDDELRNLVLTRIAECVERFDSGLSCNLRVVVTTRPPAISGKRDKLPDFTRFAIRVLTPVRVDEYVTRWVSVQHLEEDDQERIIRSFSTRKGDPHVAALVKNPMQLSVLLHFIRLKGEAFPTRRAELYADYFRTVIDRDVEKSPSLRVQRSLVVSLHQFLGYKIHALTEAKQADGTLSRAQLLRYVGEWLQQQGARSISGDQLFALGEERLGLIVTLRGEGEEARYGYEIQPIREYFAAAFLNEQIVGNAHDFYQEALKRSFWREVALFLAGLRRPNEKADLVLRARKLDEEPLEGWRQNGRVATLELIREGVFSEPSHVAVLALDFVFDLLDRTKVPLQPSTMDFWGLGKYLAAADSDRFRIRATELLNRVNNCENWATVHDLYAVVADLIPVDELREYILNARCDDPSFHAALRLDWAREWGIELDKSLLTPEFWSKCPLTIAASHLLYQMEAGNPIGVRALPAALHEALILHIICRPVYSETPLNAFMIRSG